MSQFVFCYPMFCNVNKLVSDVRRTKMDFEGSRGGQDAIVLNRLKVVIEAHAVPGNAMVANDLRERRAAERGCGVQATWKQRVAARLFVQTELRGDGLLNATWEWASDPTKKPLLAWLTTACVRFATGHVLSSEDTTGTRRNYFFLVAAFFLPAAFLAAFFLPAAFFGAAFLVAAFFFATFLSSDKR